MERFYSDTIGAEVQQVNVRTARQVYNMGLTVYCLPSRARFDTWLTVGITNVEGESFDSLTNAARFYNCNGETGRYLRYFVTCDELKRYKGARLVEAIARQFTK